MLLYHIEIAKVEKPPLDFYFSATKTVPPQESDSSALSLPCILCFECVVRVSPNKDGGPGGSLVGDAGHGTTPQHARPRGQARRGGGFLEQGEDRLGSQGKVVDFATTHGYHRTGRRSISASPCRPQGYSPVTRTWYGVFFWGFKRGRSVNNTTYFLAVTGERSEGLESVPKSQSFDVLVNKRRMIWNELTYEYGDFFYSTNTVVSCLLLVLYIIIILYDAAFFGPNFSLSRGCLAFGRYHLLLGRDSVWLISSASSGLRQENGCGVFAAGSTMNPSCPTSNPKVSASASLSRE